MSWMTGIIHEPMTFILDTCRLYHTGKLWKKHSAITVNVRSSIKTIILVSFKVPGKKTLKIWPHPLGNCLLLDPFPLEFLMPSVGGSINRILVWRVTASIFSRTYAGIHVITSGVTASFSLNFLNSLLLLNVHVFSADTKFKHEKQIKITSVNW